MHTQPPRPNAVQQEPRLACAGRHRSTAFIELITTAGLALSTAVAITAVSFGIARADAMGSVAKGSGGSFAVIALLLTVLLSLTAVMAPPPASDQRR